MTVLMYIIVYMLTGVILASAVYAIEKRDLNFWHEKIFAFVDDKRYHLQSDVDDADAQNEVFTVLAAFVWPLPIFIIILYGLLMLIRKITVWCVNGVIDIFIGKETPRDRKDDDDVEDDNRKKSIDHRKKSGCHFYD